MRLRSRFGLVSFKTRRNSWTSPKEGGNIAPPRLESARRYWIAFSGAAAFGLEISPAC